MSLSLLVLPEILERPLTIVGVAGGNISLQCTASGYPLPTITWWTIEGTVVDGKVESEEDGSGVSSVLMLIDLGHDDATQYYCTAENFLAVDITVESERTQLIVHCKLIYSLLLTL